MKMSLYLTYPVVDGGADFRRMTSDVVKSYHFQNLFCLNMAAQEYSPVRPVKLAASKQVFPFRRSSIRISWTG